MFDWLKELINGISEAITNGLAGVGEQISNSIWTTMMRWLHETVYTAVADFFTRMGNMGAEIFELKWVEATIRLFTIFGWALFVVGLVVAVFDFAIEFQSGRANIKSTALNILKGFFAFVKWFFHFPPRGPPAPQSAAAPRQIFRTALPAPADWRCWDRRCRSPTCSLPAG